jgi:release factor glutamine methyltransferase
MNLEKALLFGTKELEKEKIENSEIDAWYLLEYVCKINRTDFLMDRKKSMLDKEWNEYQKLIIERKMHIPLQYLTGRQMFMGLPFEVNKHVLIPRQDTEILVEEVLKPLKEKMEVLDMCTGSGCILVSLLKYAENTSGLGVDISSKALETAARNAELNGVKADFLKSDLFEDVKGSFDIIVSNPPYIRSEVIKTLMPEVKDFEPIKALDGDEDGLKFYRTIAEKSPEFLKPNGLLYFEIGYDQGNEVKTLMIQNGFEDIRLVKDLAGLDRVVYGKMKERNR